MNEFLTPKIPPWWEFGTRLDAALRPEGEEHYCDGTLKHTTRILAEMGNSDVPGTLDFLRNHGGHCDCEVMMNVLTRDPEDER